jgi:shikimate kinase
MKNISLVGFMGTGKTTVGKILARRLGYRFIDSDDEIEKEQGIAISHIFSEMGEPYFRALEKDMLRRLSAETGLIISTGGGAVIDPENVETLKRHGHLVCLTASPDVILERVEKHTHRPLLQVPDPRAKIKELLELRGPFYARADITIDTSGLTAGEVAKMIIEKTGVGDK